MKKTMPAQSCTYGVYILCMYDHHIHRKRRINRARLIYMPRLIAYTEPGGENHGPMILDGVSYSTFIHFCTIILYRVMNPTVVSLSRAKYCLIYRVVLSLGVYRRPCVSLSMQRC